MILPRDNDGTGKEFAAVHVGSQLEQELASYMRCGRVFHNYARSNDREVAEHPLADIWSIHEHQRGHCSLEGKLARKFGYHKLHIVLPLLRLTRIRYQKCIL